MLAGPLRSPQRLDACGKLQPAPASHRVPRVRGDVRDGPADLVHVEGHAEAALRLEVALDGEAGQLGLEPGGELREENTERHRPQDEPLRPPREVEGLRDHPLQAVRGVDDGPRPFRGLRGRDVALDERLRPAPDEGQGAPEVVGHHPGHGAERGQALRGDELLLVGVVLDGERGAGGDERDEPGLGVGDRLSSPRGGPQDEHPREPAPREEGDEHALLRARGRLQELALGEQPPSPRASRAGGLRPERAQAPPVGQPQALEALEAPVPQEEGRVVRVERPREVLGQQPGERRQVGGFQDPLGDLPERGAAARGGEGEDPHGLSIDTPKNPSL